MDNYIIGCCSTADWPKEKLEERGIPWVPFHVEINGKEYLDDGVSISLKDFYRMEREGAQPKTSQVNVEEYREFWLPFLSRGQDVLQITLSSGISGTYNAACAAAAQVSEEFPDRKIFVVDSLSASSGYGIVVEEAADLRDQGLSIEEVRDWLLANRGKMQHWFFMSDLTTLVRGGRISAVSGAMGNLLGICPLLTVDALGQLQAKEKIRTRKKVIETTVKRMEEYAEGGSSYSGRCAISHSDCLEDASKLRDLIEETFPALKGKVEICRIGSVIGAHTGPGTVALFFWGKERI